MQDKKHHTPSSDEAFVNEAWAQMAQLLDEQMPVAALPWWRQRRYYLLLLLLLLFLTSAAGLWWSRKTSTPAMPEVPAAVAQQRPEAAMQTTKSEATDALPTSTPEAKSIPVSVPGSTQSRSAYIPQTVQASTRSTESFTDVYTPEILDRETLITKNLISPPEDLPSLEAPLLSRVLPAPVLREEETIAPPSPWSLSTSAGVGMHTPGRIGLGWVDMRVQRTLGKSEKWRLGGGLGVLRSEFPNQGFHGSGFLAGVNSMEDLTSSPGGSFSSAEERAALETSLTMRYTFLRMPLEASRRLSTRLHLRFGAEAGLLLHTSSTEAQREGAIANTPIYPTEELLRTQRFDIRPTLGLGYRISRSLEADLRYQFGLIKLHPQHPATTYNRFLELGLRWNW